MNLDSFSIGSSDVPPHAEIEFNRQWIEGSQLKLQDWASLGWNGVGQGRNRSTIERMLLSCCSILSTSLNCTWARWRLWSGRLTLK